MRVSAAIGRPALALAVALLAWGGALAPARAQANNCRDATFGVEAAERLQNASRDIVGQDIDEIQERGHIVFAVYEDFAPWSFREGGSEGGELRGVDIELGRLIAGELGVEARFIERGAGENVDADLRNNVVWGPIAGGAVANVMLHVPYDRELQCRNELVVLNGLYFDESLAIAYREDMHPEKAPVPAFFRFDTVGVENDSISDFYLSSLAGGQIVPKMTRYASMDAAMDGLAAGEVSAVMGPLGQVEHGMRGREGIAVHQPPLVGLAASRWPLGVAVRHNWRPLSYAVEDAINAGLADGRIAAIFEDHGLTHVPPVR